MKSGVSQREVSRRSGLPPETICCFVHGRRGLAIESFDRLVAALGLHLTEPGGRCEAMMHEARKTRSTWGAQVLERFPGDWTPRLCGERRDAKDGWHRRVERCMASLVFDAGEFDEMISKAVDATVRRIEERQPKDAAGRVLLTKQEAAEALGVSQATVDRLRKAGLPAVKLDGKVLFRPEGLRAWAAAQESVSSGG